MHPASTPTPAARTSSSSTTPDIFHLSQKIPLSNPRPRPILHQLNPSIYNEITTSHPLKAFSKASSSLQFEFVSYVTIQIGNPQSSINKNIQIIKSSITHQKTLYQFSFKLKFLGPSNLDFLSSLLKNSPPITTLNLDLSNLHFASTSNLHSLRLAFKTLKHLSHLTLSFSQASHLNYNLLSSLKALNSLSSLSLKLSTPKNPNPSSFKKWPKYLTQIPCLTTLSLALMECVSLTDQDLTVLFSHFNKLTQINTIKISLYDSQNCTAQGLYHFFNSIKGLKKLSKIRLDIFAFNLYSYPETFAAGFALLDSQLLQDLALDISETNLTDEGFIAFCTVLEGFQSLKALDLTLARNEKISHRSLEKLALSLNKLGSLTSLEMDLADLGNYDDEEYSQGTMGIISSGLKNLRQLVYLRLDFTNLTQTRDGDLQELAQSLQNLSLLEKLSLVFNSCRNLANDGIKDLAKSLKSLGNLRYLCLDFAYLKLLNNEGLVSLAQGIRELSHLKDLEMSFLVCRGIDNEGIKDFAEGFESLRELYNVNLLLPRSAIAGGNIEGLERMFEVFRKLDSLKIITICIDSVSLPEELSNKFVIPSKEVNVHS